MKPKRTKKGRIPSIEEKILRDYHRQVRLLKTFCEEYQVLLKPYEVADPGDVCILSKSEYEFGEQRCSIENDQESYFVSAESYDLYMQIKDDEE